MLEIDVKSSRSNCVYNNQYMTQYYSLLLSLVKVNNKFYLRMLNHDNWRWSFKIFTQFLLLNIKLRVFSPNV